MCVGETVHLSSVQKKSVVLFWQDTVPSSTLKVGFVNLNRSVTGYDHLRLRNNNIRANFSGHVYPINDGVLAVSCFHNQLLYVI